MISIHERSKRHAIQVQEALKRIGPWVRTTDAIEVRLENAFGAHLAEDVTAVHPYPHFRRSGMDGFAVRSSDLHSATPENPVCLEVIGHVPAGATPPESARPGTAFRTMTGAMVADGADVVVMLEMVREREQDGKCRIEISKPARSGENVSETGSEVASGTPLLVRGRKIGAGETALLAAFGHSSVRVHRAPKVAIITTGSELLGLDQPLVPGKIRNSNALMLAALVRGAGGIPVDFGTVPDDTESAMSMVWGAFDQADVVLTSGGVSVGDFDVMTEIFRRWEGRTLFDKVAMRPGSPTTVGVWGEKLLFGLSGNPGACFVGFELFARPAISGMLGEGITLPTQTALLETDYPKTNAYPRYVRGSWRTNEGVLLASPLKQDQSGVLVSLKDAGCLIVIPAGGTGMKAGDGVSVILLEH